MLELIGVIIIGLLGGVAVGIQSPMGAAIGARVGSAASSFIVHLSGMIFSGALLFLRGGENIRDAVRLPWYMLGAGIFGVVLYLSINVTLPRLGGTMMVVLIIIGQLLAGSVVDHFGLFGAAIHPISLSRVVGMLVLLGGAYIISR